MESQKTTISLKHVMDDINMSKAIFLDRDGVINEERGYVHCASNFTFIPHSVDAMRCLQNAGYKLIVITNQSGIARGLYSYSDYEDLTQYMLTFLRHVGVYITEVYCCPHHPVFGVGYFRVDCSCRKPKSGMILRAQSEHGINLSNSILVGDKVTDIEAGRSAKIGKCILVSSGHIITDADRTSADLCCSDLMEAATKILTLPTF